jgi:hypothetical protein
MFDGLDCCGYDDNNDGDYDDSLDIAPGDTALCTECLCKGMYKYKKMRLNIAGRHHGSNIPSSPKAIYVLKSENGPNIFGEV